MVGVPNFGQSIRYVSFTGGSVVKNPPVNAGDVGSIPGLGRSRGTGNGNLLQCILPEKSCGQEEPDGLQLVGWQKSGTRLSN